MILFYKFYVEIVFVLQFIPVENYNYFCSEISWRNVKYSLSKMFSKISYWKILILLKWFKRTFRGMIAKIITPVVSFQTYIYLNKSTLTSYLRVVYCICCTGNASLYYARSMCPATRGIILGLFDKKSNTSGTGETKYRQYSNWD